MLDFSTIQRYQPGLTTAHGAPMPTDHIDKYKSRFQEAKAKHVRHPLYPAPRFDRVYQEGLAHMSEAEEIHGSPIGIVDLPAEAKERLRDQRDGEVGG